MSSERTNLLCRLAADGGRYVLTIALLPDEVEQAEKPTYGGKATSRFLTDAEYRAIFSGLHWLENQVGSNELAYRVPARTKKAKKRARKRRQIQRESCI